MNLIYNYANVQELLSNRMATGRDRSNDLVTASGRLLRAHGTRGDPGEMETGGIPPFRGFVKLFGLFSPCLFAKRFCQVLYTLETSFTRQSRQTERKREE